MSDRLYVFLFHARNGDQIFLDSNLDSAIANFKKVFPDIAFDPPERISYKDACIGDKAIAWSDYLWEPGILRRKKEVLLGRRSSLVTGDTSESVLMDIVKVPDAWSDELKNWVKTNSPLRLVLSSDRWWQCNCPRNLKGSVGVIKFREDEVSPVPAKDIAVATKVTEGT